MNFAKGEEDKIHIDLKEHKFYNVEKKWVKIMNGYGKIRIPVEVISYFKNGQIYPLRFRYYHVKKARYLVVFVVKIDYMVKTLRNGLVEKTYHVRGRNQKRVQRYALYLDPKSKSWFLE